MLSLSVNGRALPCADRWRQAAPPTTNGEVMAQPLSQDEQDDIVSRIGVGLETMDYDENEALRDQLDADHKSQVDDSIREFADNAIGDEHWDSDR